MTTAAIRWRRLRRSKASPPTGPERDDPPGVGEAEHEAGDDEDDEAEGERAVLEALLERHPEVEPVRRRLDLDEAAPDVRAGGAHFFTKSRRLWPNMPPIVPTIRPDVDEADPPEERLLAPSRRRRRGSSPGRSARPAPGWHLPQVLTRFSLLTFEAGSEEGRMSWEPWQLAQFATST